MNEEWRIINDYLNYSVSNLGKVRNDNTCRILKGIPTGLQGYLQVGLSKNGIVKNYRINRLVGIHFLPNWNNKNTIDHKNHDILDNRVFNLRWTTRPENGANRIKTKTKTTSKYIGVSFNKRDNNWRAQIQCQKINKGKLKYIGKFKTEEEGAIAYNEYILKNNLQEFYNLNFL